MSKTHEESIQDLIKRTGKTQEQIEAFLGMVASSMGWSEKPLTDDQFSERLTAFIGSATTAKLSPTEAGEL
jgi:hypothetical protein